MPLERLSDGEAVSGSDKGVAAKKALPRRQAGVGTIHLMAATDACSPPVLMLVWLREAALVAAAHTTSAAAPRRCQRPAGAQNSGIRPDVLMCGSSRALLVTSRCANCWVVHREADTA